jgi:hypothetical protein
VIPVPPGSKDSRIPLALDRQSPPTSLERRRKALQKPVPASLQLSRLAKSPIDKSKSMDNLRANALGHPVGLQPGARRGVYVPGESPNRRDTGLPRSYDAQRAIMRPSAQSSSLDLTVSTQNQYGSRGQNSLGRDLYPRPSSALGDTPTASPSTYRHGRNLSPTAQESDMARSLRALPPSHFLNPAAGVYGTRVNSNMDALSNPELHSEWDLSRTPCRSPASPLDSWAFRPPPEDVYERLEEFFPDHDLDKPVIEAPSGGISPTANEHLLIPPPQANDKSRVESKKSIRIVARNGLTAILVQMLTSPVCCARGAQNSGVAVSKKSQLHRRKQDFPRLYWIRYLDLNVRVRHAAHEI